MADALGSGPSVRKGVRVQIPPSAPVRCVATHAARIASYPRVVFTYQSSMFHSRLVRSSIEVILIPCTWRFSAYR